MEDSTLHNFHVPLPDELYSRLREEAERLNRPATVLVRQAIDDWLRHRQKAALHEAIAAYAAEHSGSDIDLDTELEAASIEHWLEEEKRR